MDTESAGYARRLVALEKVWWKRLLDVQAPYRMHLRRLKLGFVLDVGCGLGRNLAHLGKGLGVGVDHNAQSIALARSRGLEAFTVEQFDASPYARADSFDSILLSHVVEHMPEAAAVGLLAGYCRFLRPGGRIVLITPQEAGYRSDPTHVHFVDFGKAATMLRKARLELHRQYSFPLPRSLGRLFRYNEFVTIGTKPAAKPRPGAALPVARPLPIHAQAETDP